MHGGLPAQALTGASAAPLRVDKASLNLPMWGYARADHEVFVVGGSPVMLEAFTMSIAGSGSSGGSRERDLGLTSVPYVAKIDTVTMTTTIFEMTLGKTINYTGGLLMHANGFVYAVVQSVLYKIDPASMRAVTSVQ